MRTATLIPKWTSCPGQETFRQPRLLYWNHRDGQFYDISSQAGSGIAARRVSRGVAIGDLYNDGSPEIVVVNMNDTPSLLIRALTPSGRDAIGARIMAAAGGRTQVDKVRSSGYYMSQGDFRVHFGLAESRKADVTIRWPDGKTEGFPNIAANQSVTLREGKGITSTQKLAARQ